MLACENPGALWLLALIPAIFYWNRFLSRRGDRFVYFSSRVLFPFPGNKKKFTLIRWLPRGKYLVLALLILAAARPQWVRRFRVEEARGVDILLSLDISGSMASVDFRPHSRLEVAKKVIARFIERRVSDRIGLVLFAASAFSKCPLTVDYSILKTFLKEVRIGDIEDGTALGVALATSVNRIRHSTAKTRVVILLTDGVNNRGEIDPHDAARLARDFNIKVYTIGVGIEGEAPCPVTDTMGRTQYIMSPVKIDEDLLKEMSKLTGGLYFRAKDTDTLQAIFSDIDRWEKSKVSFRTYFQKQDFFVYLIGAALILLLLIEVSRRSFLRSLP